MFAPARSTVVRYLGKGMNALASLDPRMKAVKEKEKENSILSFNEDGLYPIDFVEFDVQVTRDEFPIIFYYNFILTKEAGNTSEKRVTGLSLEELLSYGPQTEPTKLGKPLFRKLEDGRVFKWNVDVDAPLCVLQEAFQNVDRHLGFNIELKFDDNISCKKKDELIHDLQAILQMVFEYANERPSFQPDAAQLMGKLQSLYLVFFLTKSGNEIYPDAWRYSLDEAIKLCLASGLQGIVAKLNNVPEAVYRQHLMGINGVIIDLVHEISEDVSDFIEKNEGGDTMGEKKVYRSSKSETEEV